LCVGKVRCIGALGVVGVVLGESAGRFMCEYWLGKGNEVEKLGATVDVGVSMMASMLPLIGEAHIGLGGAMDCNLPDAPSPGFSRLAVMVPLAPISSKRPKLVESENRKAPFLEVHSRKAMSAVVRSRILKLGDCA